MIYIENQLKATGDLFGRLPRRGSKADELTNVTETNSSELSRTRGNSFTSTKKELGLI